METMDRLRSGNFNTMMQEYQADGSVKITLTRHGDRRRWTAMVRDLYGNHEEVLWEEVNAE